MPDDRPIHDPIELDRVWADVARALRTQVSEINYQTWLEPLRPAALAGRTLYLRAPAQIRAWVTERYAHTIASTVRAVSSVASVEIVASEWRPELAHWSASAPPPSSTRTSLNPRYTFDQFVISDSNRLAHAAALAVAELPAQAYNPLFIHGRPGLGKTHLLHAIGNYVCTYGGGLQVRYATVEEFTSAFISALKGGETAHFRDHFRGVDVLLVDDIQFLAEKVRTEEEFFHTFNALYEAGSQLVISSDRKPRDIRALEARLRERFEHGLIAELDPPDFQARLAILQKRARLDALSDVEDDTLAEIATHVTSSVRTLEGALVRVVAYASLQGMPPSRELAQHVLARLYRTHGLEHCTLEEIQAATAETFSLERAQLLAHDRRPQLAFARQVAMYLARELTSETLPAIGRSFGNRNHSTVLHAHRRVSTELDRDSSTANAVEAVKARLRRADGDRS